MRLRKKLFLNVRLAVYEKECILAKPLTFMNTSGGVIKNLLKSYTIHPTEIIVVYDDLSLDFGSMKMRLKGGSAGHNGVESIIDALGTEQFPRIRIGIGRPEDASQFKEYVLEEVPEERRIFLQERVFPHIYKAFLMWKDKGREAAMNYINSKENVEI